MSVVEATEASIRAAKHLSPMDAGAVEALRVLAVKLDELDESGKFDNVTIPTYLKFCESLGLTPAGRLRLDAGEKESAGGKLAQLRTAAGAAPERPRHRTPAQQSLGVARPWDGRG